MLVEETIVPAEALPIADLRAHLRMGTGFADDNMQDGLLERHLRAALAAIEARTGKILIARDFSWTVTLWRDPVRQPIPAAPVEDVTAITLVDAAGIETTADPAGWVLMPDASRPLLAAARGCLPTIPRHGRARVALIAGYGPAWADIPHDLAQAVLQLAGHFYEFRHSAEGRGSEMPAAVSALIAPYRTVRVFMGGRGV